MSTRSFHLQLVALQREIYQRNQERIAARVRDADEDLRVYQERYRRHTRTYQEVVSPEEFHAELTEADVIYLGDYHTLKQAQKTCVRLLRRLAPVRPDLCVGLEVVQGRHQHFLDRHLSGGMDEETFLKRIGFRKHWVFGSFAPFRGILELIREHGLSALALDLAHGPGVTLAQRDAYAAERIATALSTGRPVLAFMGELHMAPPHLPAAVKKALRTLDKARASTLKQVVVYQNPEGIYERLSRQGLEHQVEVVRVKAGVFAINAVPPILCQQSFLVWLEEDDQQLEDVSFAAEQFRESARVLARLLGLNVDEALEAVKVHCVGNLKFLDELHQQRLINQREFARLRTLMTRGESFYLPRARLCYLASPSLNHAGEEAGHFVRHACAGDGEPRGAVDAFYFVALNEMMGFFGSKILNHRRKAPDIRAMNRLARSTDALEMLESRVAALALGHRKDELGGRGLGILEVLAAAPSLQFGVAHVLGYWLGDRLYYAIVQDKISPTEVRELFCAPLCGHGEATRTYFHWSELLRPIKPPPRL